MIFNFRDILATSITIELQPNTTVSDACQILCQKLKIQGYKILLISPNANQNYYPNDYSMINVLKENPEFVMFTKYINTIQDRTNTLKKYINTYIDLHLYNVNHPSHYLYEQYSQALNNVHSDCHDKVNQIADYNFLVDDIKESNHDAKNALNLMTSQNSNKNVQSNLKLNFINPKKSSQIKNDRNRFKFSESLQNKKIIQNSPIFFVKQNPNWQKNAKPSVFLQQK